MTPQSVTLYRRDCVESWHPRFREVIWPKSWIPGNGDITEGLTNQEINERKCQN